MKAKDYLMQCRQIEQQILQIDTEIQSLRDEQILLRSPWPDGQPHGTGKSDPVGNQAAKIADQIAELEVKALKKRGELWAKRSEIIETIGMVDDERLNRLLWLRYVQGASFEEVAVDMHYTYRHIISLHGEALRQIEEIITK